MIGFGIRAEHAAAARDDGAGESGRRIVQDDQVHLVGLECAAYGADQAQARVETARFIRIPVAVEEDGDVDVALAVGPAFSMAAETYTEITRPTAPRNNAARALSSSIVDGTPQIVAWATGSFSAAVPAGSRGAECCRTGCSAQYNPR